MTSRSEERVESDAVAIEALNRARPHDLGSSGLKWDVASPDSYPLCPSPADVLKQVAFGAAVCIGGTAACLALGFGVAALIDHAHPWIEAGKSAVLAWWLR